MKWVRDGLRRLSHSETKFLFIVGHGRDGSTLLQHLINISGQGACIWGENIVGLQLASLVGTLHSERRFQNKPRDQLLSSSHPWFGVDQIDLEKTTQMASRMFIDQFIRVGHHHKLVGFKEIRFLDLPNVFLGLEKIVGHPKFVFIQRDVQEMKRSGWWADTDGAALEIARRQGLARDIQSRLDQDSSLLIRYEELVAGAPVWEDLGEFAGINFDKDIWLRELTKPLNHSGPKPPWAILYGPATRKLDLGG